MSSAVLLPHHAQMLEQSGIAREVIEARLYRSIERSSQLAQLGFGSSQRLVPTLLIPVWSVNGGTSLYHHRPDTPRVKDGKLIKYEFPSGSQMCLDVHPFVRDKVRDPRVAMVFTEGIKKGDAAVSRGLCCISLLGVWNWRGTNEAGGKTALPDWETIALKSASGAGRWVYIAFDSDAWIKHQVYLALVRLSEFLKSRGANVAYIYLPHGEDGSKTGLDDYLAQGHSVQDFFALATTELRTPPGQAEEGSSLPYVETPHGIVWRRPTRDGYINQQLTNFTARVFREVEEDDGAETTLSIDIQAELNGLKKSFRMPAQNFVAMNWHIPTLGTGAVILPGSNTKDQARAAIQLISGTPPRERVYQHTGWREVSEGKWAYLHAAGSIEADPGPELSHTDQETVENSTKPKVQLSGQLGLFRLPEAPEGETLRAAIRASLALLNLAPDHLTCPLFAALWRAACGLEVPDFSIHLVGQSGKFKTELGALIEQHFGPEMSARNLPASWSSTENALEALAFAAKDAILVIDDYVPKGPEREVQRLHAKAERVLRAQGNSSGRQRMRVDGTLRVPRPPRGLILSTGEDTPPGQSLRGRILILEVGPRDISPQRLSACQRDAANGLYASAMAGFLKWLAPRFIQERSAWKERVRQFRELLESSPGGQHGRTEHQHRRTSDIVANLAGATALFVRFATEAGAISGAQAKELVYRVQAALDHAASLQAQHQVSGDPATNFIELISVALASGRAHVANQQGAKPSDPSAWGWRAVSIGSTGYQRTEWQPLGERVGWIHEEYGHLYLIPAVSYKVAKRLASDGEEGLTITQRTLWKRLKEKGFLETTDKKRSTLTIRRKLEGATHDVLHISPATISRGSPDISDIDDLADMKGVRTGYRGQAENTQEDIRCQVSVSDSSVNSEKPDIEPEPNLTSTYGTQEMLPTTERGNSTDVGNVGKFDLRNNGSSDHA
jgi:hypothetical protein